MITRRTSDYKITESEQHVVRYATLIRAEPESVYDAFAPAEDLDGWFTSGAVVEPRPGGRILFRWKEWGVDRVSLECGGTVLESDRPHRFVFQWNPIPEEPDHLTTVELTFATDERGSVVSVCDGVFPDTEAGQRAFIDCCAGWGEALTLAKFYVERGLRY